MDYQIPAQASIGHVHLKVSDLERALSFYRDLLGFKIVDRYPDVVFIAAGDYHHHIGLNTWYSNGAPPASPYQPGLFHTAILYPTRKDLATIYQRLLDANYPFTGYADHGVSEALYLDDPDGNGVELYWDKPREQWSFNEDGKLQIYTKRLNLSDLLRELN
ncbi:MAG: VOC family protein [Saprospiraceae bacterium]